jgi:iron complex transport system ATP-binding protein
LADIAPGAVTALVGPNAAGKSTLLRALAGLIPASGAVRFAGTDLLRLDPAERAKRVAFMPQLLPANAALTVLEAVIAAQRASPLERSGASEREVRQRAMAVLERIEIAALALEPLDRLSGGQRQLASLAQAVVREPRILLLDEPTSALDLRHQFHVMDIVRSIARAGRIVVVVLHDLNLAAQFADRIVVLEHGTVRADGSPEAAMTADILADVYGVAARVERCSRGRLQSAIDGLVPSQSDSVERRAGRSR